MGSAMSSRMLPGIPTVAGGFVASITDASGLRWSCVSYAYVPEHLLLATAERAALDALADAPRTAETWGLIHADLRPSNIMIADDTLTVIDFDDCGYSWFLYDFASALTFMEHVEDAPTMAAEWVAGYLEVRPFTTDDARTACALSMLQHL